MFNSFRIPFLLLLAFLGGFSCKEPTGSSSKSSNDIPLVYAAHSDAAKYVGINTCKTCHKEIYDSFLKTGMGQSFDKASRSKSVADFNHPEIYDSYSELHYKAYWQNEDLFFYEYKIENKDTVFKRKEQVNYIIGSGQHTNSHIQNVNGYLNQMPMTFYAQKKKWDLPPGFEDGHNTRFGRKIGLECMSCHNAYPNFVLGSENKYYSVPNGIDCERCHGPGSIHVAQRSSKEQIDTSRFIDYSIVNPGKLAIDLQFDVCQRCHLQGNAVLKEGKSFYDFKPGMKLSDFITVFLPKYSNSDEEFIMASHADRLKQSQCFIKTFEKADPNSLRPYKEALTCVTCHNPHLSVKETNQEKFNGACINCHQPNGKSKLFCNEKSVVKLMASHTTGMDGPNCVSCHMPSSGSIDIPHVTVHDHYIRKPINKTEKDKVKKFLGLYAVNESKPSHLTRAWAFINQYNKFDPRPEFLDSAIQVLSDKTKDEVLKNKHALIQIYFSKQNYAQVLNYVNIIGDKNLMDLLKNKTYDNINAWTAYHVAEAYLNTNQIENAVVWFEKATSLAPFNLEFRLKLGSAYVNSGRVEAAKKEFKYVITENPKIISAYTNLGFIEMTQNNLKDAVEYFNKGLALDINNEPLLFNIVGLKFYLKDYKGAIEIVNRILKQNPKSEKAKQVLEKIKSLV